MLLGSALVIMFPGMVITLVLSPNWREIGDVTFMIGVTLMALAWGTNATCGVHHKRFEVRGSANVSSLERRGYWFWFDVAMFYALAALCLRLAFLLWGGYFQ